MELRRIETAYQDARGRIVDLVEADMQRVALFTTRRGATRGGHYHLRSTVRVYVLEGTLALRWRGASDMVCDHIVQAGELVTIEPLERHELTALEDSTWLMMISGPNGGRQYDGDTVVEAV